MNKLPDDKNLQFSQNIPQMDADYFRDLNAFAKSYYPNNDADSVMSLIKTNPKIEYRYFCFRYLDDIRQFKLPELKQDSRREAVIVEFRELPHLEFILRNAMIKLGDLWSFTIICGNKNYDFMKNMVDEMRANIKIIKYDLDNIDQDSYSAMLADKEFWNRLSGEKILTFQEDSCIFNSNIEEFMEWDYIGAPWPLTKDTNTNLVGNGGLSLRTKAVMLKVINNVDIHKTKYNQSTIDYVAKNKLTVPPEDVYFSKNMIDLSLGKVANWTSANKFSVESQYYPNPFGGHNFWMGIKDWKALLYEKCLNKTIK